jgi:hypothetical protein
MRDLLGRGFSLGRSVAGLGRKARELGLEFLIGGGGARHGVFQRSPREQRVQTRERRCSTGSGRVHARIAVKAGDQTHEARWGAGDGMI